MGELWQNNCLPRRTRHTTYTSCTAASYTAYTIYLVDYCLLAPVFSNQASGVELRPKLVEVATMRQSSYYSIQYSVVCSTQYSIHTRLHTWSRISSHSILYTTVTTLDNTGCLYDAECRARHDSKTSTSGRIGHTWLVSGSVNILSRVSRLRIPPLSVSISWGPF